MKRFLSVIICVCLIFSLLSFNVVTVNAASTESYYTYSIWDGEATITDVNSIISGDITIPSTLGGYPVTNIGRLAFYGCADITSITIPNSVTYIRDSAFGNCTQLENVIIPNSVKSIGGEAFYNCIELEKIILPDNLTYLGNYAFERCSSLKEISIPHSITNLYEGLFYQCTNLVYVDISDGVIYRRQCFFCLY